MTTNSIPATAPDFYSIGAFFADIEEPIIGIREPGMIVTDPLQAKERARLQANVEKAIKLSSRRRGPDRGRPGRLGRPSWPRRARRTAGSSCRLEKAVATGVSAHHGNRRGRPGPGQIARRQRHVPGHGQDHAEGHYGPAATRRPGRSLAPHTQGPGRAGQRLRTDRSERRRHQGKVVGLARFGPFEQSGFPRLLGDRWEKRAEQRVSHRGSHADGSRDRLARPPR